MSIRRRIAEKPHLESDECWCSTDDGHGVLVLTGCLETAAQEAAEEFFYLGDYPEEQEIFVERGDGIKKKFLATAQKDVWFSVEEKLLTEGR